LAVAEKCVLKKGQTEPSGPDSGSCSCRFSGLGGAEFKGLQSRWGLRRMDPLGANSELETKRDMPVLEG
jgi:hypothetical protein